MNRTRGQSLRLVKVDRGAPFSGDIDATPRIGSTIPSVARGLPVRTAISTGSNRLGCETSPKHLPAEPSNLGS